MAVVTERSQNRKGLAETWKSDRLTSKNDNLVELCHYVLFISQWLYILLLWQWTGFPRAEKTLFFHSFIFQGQKEATHWEAPPFCFPALFRNVLDIHRKTSNHADIQRVGAVGATHKKNTSDKKILLGTRTLLLGAPGIATRSKDVGLRSEPE